MQKALELHSGIIQAENFQHHLRRLMSVDADISGENGPDYLSKEAEEKGFTNDLDWYIAEAIKEHGETERAIKEVGGRIFASSGYYGENDIQIHRKGDVFFVAIGFITIV